MAKLGLVCFLLSLMLIVQTMAHLSNEGSGANPSEIKSEKGVESHVRGTKIADQPVSVTAKETLEGEEEESEVEAAEAPQNVRRLGKHHSSDMSVAGGGVIIGGLLTAIFAAVFCYIRVTRRRNIGVH